MEAGDQIGEKVMLIDFIKLRVTPPEYILRCSLTHTRPSNVLPDSNVLPAASIVAGFNI